MKDYLFRGKRLDDGEWVYGYFVQYGNGRQSVIYTDAAFGEHKSFEVDYDTVSKYVGSEDKSGKKIFEGDIVKTKYNRLCIVLRFQSACFNGFNLKPICEEENLKNKCPDKYDLWLSENLEIVGDIF